jgi:hypothetical protein
MKIIHSSWFPFGRYRTINLFGILITKNKIVSQRTINHESIHTAQMKETLYVGFYLWYVIEFLIRWIFQTKFNWHEAYRNVSFEREAFSNELDDNYLKYRVDNSWFYLLL